mmetsp:Transcript_56497/g.112317  ORF Transcript_56497/g.112317 Transcript_56497/m.112317 type:complete len:382 (-) Transcript_56497:46-1191(-)
MKRLSALGLLVVLRAATEVWANEPPRTVAAEEVPHTVATGEAPEHEPNLEGKKPTEIEKMLMEEMLKKPKGSKGGFNFAKTVGKTLKKFKTKLLKDKRGMQRRLDGDIRSVRRCAKTMRRKLRAGLLETDASKKKCPSKKKVRKCVKRVKVLKRGKSKACKDLERVADKDVKTIFELVKEWNKKKVLKRDCKLDKGETVFHYVSRLTNHFGKKLAKFNVRLHAKSKAITGKKKLDKKCNFIKHYARKLEMKTCKNIKAANYACSCGKYAKEVKICSSMKGCYDAARRALITNRKAIRKKNVAAKLEWRAVGRIECLLKVMGKKKGKPDAKQLNKCVKGRAIDTRPLNLAFRGIPRKPRCAMPRVTPKMRKMCRSASPKKYR